MRQQQHKVWRVMVGSLDDEALRDRVVHDGRRFVATYKLPLRAEYLIEAKGQGKRAAVKALRLAAEEGIVRPVMLSIEWINHPFLTRRGPTYWPLEEPWEN